MKPLKYMGLVVDESAICEGEHDFVEFRPPNHQSGWHEIRCQRCGFVKEGFDTSD